MTYEDTVAEIVHKTLSRPIPRLRPAYDPLMTPEEHGARAVYSRSKTIIQRHGHVWQRCIGAYEGFEDLGEGHPSGLDIIHHGRKIIMEVKNATNTDNSSSRNAKLSLLADYKRDHTGNTTDHQTSGSATTVSRYGC